MATRRSLDTGIIEGGKPLNYYRNTSDVARVLKDVAGEYEEMSPAIAVDFAENMFLERYTSTADIGSLPKILQFGSEDRMTKFSPFVILSR